MSKRFVGGNSTNLEVTALMEKLQIEAGIVVSYDDIEKIVGADRKSYRFTTIMTSWKKRVLREKGLEVRRADGEVKFLTANEAHDSHVVGLHRIGRATGRLAKRTDLVDVPSLSGERRDGHTLVRREVHELLDTVRKSAKVIAGPRPVAPANLRIAK